MASDPQVALTFLHNLPRYEAIGVDPNDLRALIKAIDRWEDWCRLWSEAGARHEALAREAQSKGLRVTAAEAFIRASVYYHCGKHLSSCMRTQLLGDKRHSDNSSNHTEPLNQVRPLITAGQNLELHDRKA